MSTKKPDIGDQPDASRSAASVCVEEPQPGTELDSLLEVIRRQSARFVEFDDSPADFVAILKTGAADQ